MKHLMGALTVLSGACLAAPHAHGISHLDVAVDGARLELSWRAALDDVVGFEHAPRTPAQKQQVAQVMERLGQPQSLWVPSPAARCELKATAVHAPVLQGGTAGSGHGDLTLTAQWLCAEPSQLKQLDAALMDTFKRVRQIESQVVTSRGQSKVTLRRGKARVIALNP